MELPPGGLATAGPPSVLHLLLIKCNGSRWKPLLKLLCCTITFVTSVLAHVLVSSCQFSMCSAPALSALRTLRM